ncbi:MAG: T9SS type A sorting domain-containing protein [Bacteroidia bacterium]
MRKIYFSMIAVFLTALAANAQLGRAVQFDSIQYVSHQNLAQGNDDPEYFGEDESSTLVIEGVVCKMHPGFYGLSSSSRKSTMVFSKDHTGKWSGLEVMAQPGTGNNSGDLDELFRNTKFYENFIPGLTVKFQGVLGSYQNNTQLYLTDEETEVTNLTKTEIEATVVSIDSFKNLAGEDQLVTGEPYEHVYVEFQNVTVVDRYQGSDKTRWYWSIKDANGLTISTRDYSGYYRTDGNNDSTIVNNNFAPPAEGTKLDFLRGVIVQSNNGYQIAPLVPSDIGLGDVVPATISGVTYEPAIPSSTDDVTVSAEIVDDESVESAVVYYAVGIESVDWKMVDMSNTDGDTWEGVIPKQANEAVVKLYIEAKDNKGNISYGPDQSGMGSLFKVIDGGLRKISDIQMTPKVDGSSIYEDKTLDGIVLTGVVTATVNYLGLTVIQDGTDPYSAIFISSQAGDGLSQLKRGDILTITKATVTEEFGVTHLSDIEYTKADGSELPEAIKDLDISTFQSATDVSEGYEGMYMEWTDVVVADTAPDFPGFYGEFAFATDLQEETPQLRVDDLSPFLESNFANDTLELGQELAYIKGIMYYSFGNFKLLPRDKNDIDGYYTQYPESVNEANAYLELKVFPNPTRNYLNVNLNAKKAGENIKVSIVDMAGKIVLSENMSESNIHLNISDLPSGLYQLQISSNNVFTAYPVLKN